MDDRPFSLIANLAKTPPPDQQRTGDKVDFVSAMQTLGYASVFDILRSSKKSFVREVRSLSDANAELAYENAQCYATQIVRFYRNELISSGRKPALTARTGVRSLVEIGPSFPNLFQENWDEFCRVGAIESKDSPVAYLTSLYRFALQELEDASEDTKKIPINLRRPDLASLLIDQQSTFKPIPVLDIVKNVLETGIHAYTDALPEGDSRKDKTIHQLIAAKKHPFLFPYNYQHQQIQAGLSGKKPMLGEINYRISLQLPIYQMPSNAYGAVTKSSTVAQLLMSNLSPEQQLIVTEPSVFDAEDSAGAYNLFYDNYYNSSIIEGQDNPLITVKTFLEKTGLNADELEALIANFQHFPFKSPNAGPPPPSTQRVFGAQYINKQNADNTYGISLAEQKLNRTTHKSFDRIQRIIRLQRWTGLPFVELDTLLAAAAFAEVDDAGGQENADIHLNTNTLRTIGLYSYFNKYYGITAEEISAIIYRISTFGVGDRLAQFDRIFNHPQLFSVPLVVGATQIWVFENEENNQLLVSQLCAALDIEQSHESLGVLNTDIRDYYAAMAEDGSRPKMQPTTALWSLSSYYRQVRIARMFGLSVKETHDLIDLLGGGKYRHTIVSGRIASVPGPDADPDLLDVLMQMEWGVKWLNETGQDVATLRARIGLGAVTTPESLLLLDALNQLAMDTQDTLLNAQTLAQLSLPATDTAGGAIEWRTLLSSIVDEHGLVLALPLTLENDSRAAIREKLDTAVEAIDLGDTKDKIADQLTDHILGRLLLQQRLVEGLFQKLSGLPMNRADVVVRWAGSDVQRLLSTVVVASKVTKNQRPRTDDDMEAAITAVNSVLRFSEVCLHLNLSEPALRTFLVHPEWLDPSFVGAALPLNLAAFYQLDRYSRWVADSGAPEEQLLQYFVVANANASDKDPCAAALQKLIDLPTTEILAAAAAVLLPASIAKSMSAVDWLRRVKATSEAMAVTATNVIVATSLDPAFVGLDELALAEWRRAWQTVGEAVVAPPREH